MLTSKHYLEQRIKVNSNTMETLRTFLEAEGFEMFAEHLGTYASIPDVEIKGFCFGLGGVVVEVEHSKVTIRFSYLTKAFEMVQNYNKIQVRQIADYDLEELRTVLKKDIKVFLDLLIPLPKESGL